MGCLECANGALRDATDAERDKTLRRMAKMRMVNCTISPLRATFHATGYLCKRFAPADEKTAEARRRWAAAQGIK